MSTKKDFSVEELSNNLNERVKELECLYSITRITVKHKNNTKTCLEEIVNEIPKGFQYPKLTEVFLSIGEYIFGLVTNKDHALSVDIVLSDGRKGVLLAGYSEQSNPNTELSFLIEEEALLRQIGYEVVQILEAEIGEKKSIQLRDKMRFNDRLNALSEITGGIAHELNTPLSNILGYSELLMKSETDPQRKDDIGKVIKSTIHAREIVKKLMFFSCDLPTNYEPNNLNVIVKDSLDLLKIQLNDKSIRSKVKLDQTLPLLRLDVFQFTQVIFNIVRNSIQAMDYNGVLEIETTNHGDEVSLSIIDNGCGMGDKEIQNLFKPFVSGKKGKNNMGIGLSVTHGIVKAHKGKLEVESNLNKGSRFTIILPTN